MATAQTCSSRGKTYLIIESIFSKGGIPQIANTVGPALTQVLRQIATKCDVQDLYYKGKAIDENVSMLQQAIMWLSNNKIESRPTGASMYDRLYVGYRNVVVPMQVIGDLVPDYLTKPRILSKAFSPIPYGVDPIPAIQLYGNKAITFVSTGGDNPPTAMALYHTDTHKLELLGEMEITRILQKLDK